MAGFRVGIGYDIHPLVEGRDLVLGGIEIPSDRGLGGHSDADVLTHAVIDALLGALADGDIGQHFPDTDPQYAGARSLGLLEHVVTRLIEPEGWEITNVDSTLLAEAPRLAPHVGDIRQSLAESLRIPPTRVSVKATTCEGFDAVGQKQAIAAQAVALIARCVAR